MLAFSRPWKLNQCNSRYHCRWSWKKEVSPFAINGEVYFSSHRNARQASSLACPTERRAPNWIHDARPESPLLKPHSVPVFVLRFFPSSPKCYQYSTPSIFVPRTAVHRPTLSTLHMASLRKIACGRTPGKLVAGHSKNTKRSLPDSNRTVANSAAAPLGCGENRLFVQVVRKSRAGTRAYRLETGKVSFFGGVQTIL